MQRLFNRAGLERKANAGNNLYQYLDRCSRCGGMARSARWAMSSLPCDECGGSGRGAVRTERLYTAERLERLRAAVARREAATITKLEQDKRIEQARRDAQHGQLEVRHQAALQLIDQLIEWTDDTFWKDLRADLVDNPFLASSSAHMIVRRHCEVQARLAKDKVRAQLGHAGKVGQRIEVRARVVSSKFIKAISTWPLIESHLITLETEQGHILKWWTGKPIEPGEDFELMRATIKELGEFRGVPQTTVQRVSFREA